MSTHQLFVQGWIVFSAVTRAWLEL